MNRGRVRYRVRVHPFGDRHRLPIRNERLRLHFSLILRGGSRRLDKGKGVEGNQGWGHSWVGRKGIPLSGGRT